jgi:hypothetical protein
MRKFGVVVVKPRNKNKGLPSCATRTCNKNKKN